jgi:uncharacterized membrane protein
MQRNVSHWERLASLAAGAALVGLAARSRRWRSLTASTGAGLIGRSTTQSGGDVRSMTRVRRCLAPVA